MDAEVTVYNAHLSFLLILSFFRFYCFALQFFELLIHVMTVLSFSLVIFLLFFFVDTIL